MRQVRGLNQPTWRLELLGVPRRRGVLVVADVLASGGGVALVVDVEHCEVGHEAVRRRAVPVVLAGLEEDAVAGPDDLERAVAPLAEADAFQHPDRLAVGMGVPGGAGDFLMDGGVTASYFYGELAPH